MRRGLWILFVIAVIASGLGLTLRQDGAIEREMVTIVEMTDPASRSKAALAFVLDHSDLDQEPLWEMLGIALDSAVEAHGEARAVAIGESLATLELPPTHRQEVLSYLSFRHMQSDDPQALARGEAILRELLAMRDVSQETLALSTWLQATHEESDKRLALEAALRAYDAARERGGFASVLYPIDVGISAFVQDVAERRGLDAALSAADSLARSTGDGMLRGLARAQSYRLAVDDDPERAARAARELATLEAFEAPDILNEIAYDMAERRFEPGVALTLSERALELARSRSDSVNILDTAGWAAYAAGRYDLAVDSLERSVGMTSETLSLDVVQVEHLIEAYEAAGELNGAIDLLAKIVARSPEGDGPARALLEQRVVERDGSTGAIDSMIARLRYEGIDEAPPFALPDRSGETVALEDLRGRIVVVTFWGYG